MAPPTTIRVPRVAEGEIVLNTPLAETLKAIAKNGPDAFYNGDIAKGILEGQKRFRSDVAGSVGGSMTQADLDALNTQIGSLSARIQAPIPPGQEDDV